jgi:A/G-specific adenine glycosylase
MPVGAVDTNVRRVLGRIVAGGAGMLPPSEVQRLADAAVPPERAGDWTHAVMDVGATVCRPRRPDCGACPARPWCRHATAAAAGAVSPWSSTTAAREHPAPFRTTSRWLRGRILDRLREALDGEWVVLDGSIGEHDPAAVERAVRALAKDGLLELGPHGSGTIRARLPTA